jgi:hypothetical protein
LRITLEKINAAEPRHIEDVQHIAYCMRPEDEHERIEAGVTEGQAAQLPDHSVESYIFYLNSTPVFVFGSIVTGHHSRVIWGYGTWRTVRVIPSITRWVRDTWFPEQFDSGVRRVEVRVPQQSVHSILWLKKLGAVIEAVDMLGITQSGRPAVQMAYTTKEHNDVLLLGRWRQQPAASSSNSGTAEERRSNPERSRKEAA